MNVYVPTISEIYHLDWETFSEADLPEVGAYRYAEDPTTEILMGSIAPDGEEPELWLPERYQSIYMSAGPRAYTWLEKAFTDPRALIYAHNAQFERAVAMFRARKDLGLPCPRQEQWRCTQAMARKAAMPDSLEMVGEALGLSAKKDNRGKALIRLFSGLQTPRQKKGQPPQPDYRVFPLDEPEKFCQFGDYCLQDNRVEQQVHKKLKPFDLKGDSLRVFITDIKINDRGIPVNVPALRHARELIDATLSTQYEAFFKIVGYRPKQRDRCKEWFEANGLYLENMRQDTLEEAVKTVDTTKPVGRALQLYMEVNYAAAKKVHSMLDCMNFDGRVRGTLLYHGAGTGRWAGRLIQPHNFKKPTINSVRTKDTPADQLDNTDIAYQMIRDKAPLEVMRLIWGNPLEVIASCIRNFIHSPTGFLDADYNAIESRIVCWLFDQHDVLEMYRKGRDLYRFMAGRIYGVGEDDIRKGSDEREVGKRTWLGCGFNMAREKFRDSCKEQYGIIISDELAQRCVAEYREVCFKVKEGWWITDKAAKAAVAAPGKVFRAGPKITFVTHTISGIPFLIMTLPSKRNIVYPYPQLHKVRKKFGDKVKEIQELTFWGNIKGKKWGRVKTYGGKLVENATQGVAACIMGHGASNCFEAGYPIDTLIHDQGLGENASGRNIETFVKLLTTLPPWAEGLPIVAEGKPCEYYKKG